MDGSIISCNSPELLLRHQGSLSLEVHTCSEARNLGRGAGMEGAQGTGLKFLGTGITSAGLPTT